MSLVGIDGWPKSANWLKKVFAKVILKGSQWSPIQVSSGSLEVLLGR